jgi:hypothetical protein
MNVVRAPDVRDRAHHCGGGTRGSGLSARDPVHPKRATQRLPSGATVCRGPGERPAACTRGALMTDTGSSRPDLDTTRVAYSTAPEPTAWVGWVVFAAFLMMLNGFIQMLEGLMALVNDDYYHVTSRGLAVSVNYTTWGWVHLLLGAVILAAGFGVLAGNLLARSVGVVLAGINAVVALLFIEAAPFWGILLITVDVLVIYALTVHGRELRDAPM